jgi:hypothetical protein
MDNLVAFDRITVVLLQQKGIHLDPIPDRGIHFDKKGGYFEG